MVKDEIAAVLQQYKASGAELIMGVGNFVAPKTLEVRLNDGGKRVLAGDHNAFFVVFLGLIRLVFPREMSWPRLAPQFSEFV
jgi:hypothetical protein